MKNLDLPYYTPHKISSKYIDYIAAVNGGIEMRVGSSKCRFRVNSSAVWSDTVEGVAHAIYEFGIAETVMGSSSMDFASEAGFATDDGAMKLWKDALERAGV